MEQILLEWDLMVEEATAQNPEKWALLNGTVLEKERKWEIFYPSQLWNSNTIGRKDCHSFESQPYLIDHLTINYQKHIVEVGWLPVSRQMGFLTLLFSFALFVSYWKAPQEDLSIKYLFIDWFILYFRQLSMAKFTLF